MAKDALKEAIAEAKTLRETAIANAKLALEEAFTPKIQSMLSAKLNEMEDLDEEQVVSEMEDETMDEMSYSEESPISEEELDEILAELNLEEGEKETVEEELDEEIDIDALLKEVEEEKEEKSEAPEGDDDEELDLESMTVADLKQLITDIVADLTSEMGGGEMEMDDVDVEIEDEAGEAEEMGDEEEVTLEELLAELEQMEEGEEVIDEKKDEMYEEKDEKMMAEVESLKQELNEVNLLNSKLLYVSKLFKENNLSESQKLKIVDTFDKATTAKEAKLVYETLKESIDVKQQSRRSSINESLSFASKAVGVASPKPIIETDATVARFQKLAGL
jgi:hypothetical protein